MQTDAAPNAFDFPSFPAGGQVPRAVIWIDEFGIGRVRVFATYYGKRVMIYEGNEREADHPMLRVERKAAWRHFCNGEPDFTSDGSCA